MPLITKTLIRWLIHIDHFWHSAIDWHGKIKGWSKLYPFLNPKHSFWLLLMHTFVTINQDTLNIEACTSLSLVTVPLYYKPRLLLRITAIGIDLFCRQCCCCCTVLCMSIQPQQQQEITVTNGVAPHNLSLFAQNVTNNSPNHFLFQWII